MICTGIEPWVEKVPEKKQEKGRPNQWSDLPQILIPTFKEADIPSC